MRSAFVVAAALLAGCAQSSMPLSVSSGANALAPAAKTAAIPTNESLLFVADGLHDRVAAFSQTTLHFVGSITGSMKRPAGIAMTSDGTLYVASQGTNTVLGFRRGWTKPFISISVPGAFGLAADAKNDLFVSSALAGSDASKNAVYEFPYDATTHAPATTASRTITVSNIPSGDTWGPAGMTMGLYGDLYIADDWRQGGPCGCLWALSANSTKPKPVLPLAPQDVATRVRTVVGRRFEEFYVAEMDGSVAGAIGVAVYPPGALQPSSVITQGLRGPGFLTFGEKGVLFVSDTYGTHHVVAYRSGAMKPFATITAVLEPEGLATYVPAVKQ